MTIGAWRTGYCVVNGFRQFYRDWQSPKEHHPPVLALHGSLTQSGMWIALAFAFRPKVVVCSQSGHFPNVSEPDLVISALKQFLFELLWRQSWDAHMKIALSRFID